MTSRIRSYLAALTTPRELPFAPGERSRTASQERRSQAGLSAEEAAVAHLRKQGYRILCRNRVNRIGELDIVARKGDRAVFVEVRARREGAPVPAKDTLTAHKRRTLAKAIELFQRQHRLQQAAVRADLIAVTQDGAGGVVRLEHFEGIALQDR